MEPARHAGHLCRHILRLGGVKDSVHTNIGRIPRGFRYVAVDVPDDARIDQVAPDAVPGWDTLPPRASQSFGDSWLRAAKALVLLVPVGRDRWTGHERHRQPAAPGLRRLIVANETPVQWDPRLLPAPVTN